jgi:3-methyl-2-oxobutanoate hydroxymethyltransferase
MRVTVPQILDLAAKGERIPVITAYDAPTARLIDGLGIPIILVGDSLGNVVLGYESTVPVSMDAMIHHSAAVVRGTENALIVGDMPFMSYQASEDEAMRNAGRFLKEAGCQAVKLEGGVRVAPLIRRMVDAGIPVMGHIGFTPQSSNQFGRSAVQGRNLERARVLLEDAIAVEEAGAFAIVLELVTSQVSRLISDRLRIPTIGIGAGPHCDGQVQVLHDILGLDPRFKFRHARRYAELGEALQQAVRSYIEDVRGGSFPTQENAFSMTPEEERALSTL